MVWWVQRDPEISLLETAFVDCAPNEASYATIGGVAPAEPIDRNNHDLVAFDDAVDENAFWQKAMDPTYDVVKSLRVAIDWVAESAIVGDVKFDVAFERLAPGGQDIDVDGFAAAKSVTSTTAGSSGVMTRSTIDFTSAEADSLIGGDDFRLLVSRDTAVGGNMVGDAEVLRVTVSELT